MFYGKKVIIIRHAQSAAQAAPRKSRGTDAALLDARLTELGTQQATNTKPPQDVDLVVVSPLSRAIQTACILFRGAEFDHIPFISNPDAAEFPVAENMTGWENVGRRLHSVKGDIHLAKYRRFKDIDFGLLSGYKEKYGTDWWTSSFDMEIIKIKQDRFRKWLQDRPEKRIAVVGHCNALMHLVQTPFRIDNCKPIYCKLYYSWWSRTIRIKRSDHPFIKYLWQRHKKRRKAVHASKNSMYESTHKLVIVE